MRRVLRDPGPLWRPLDRARSRARLLLICGLLLVLAAGAVQAAHGVATAPARARAQAERLHRVDASVLGAAGSDAPAVAGRLRAGEQVRAAWTYPAGHPVTGRFALTGDAAPGQSVPIWVTDRGDLADPPPSAAGLALLAVAAAAVCLLAFGLLVYLLYLLRCRSLDHRAQRQWAADWARVEPHWSGRVDGRPGSPAA
ncbi:hypothetical protein C7C46_23455 [Streptomyces tateyamensis]|uniref:Uncharacterized protein n=1 Tax=Streptomyces tateyamensis TaxID=565073 RepID=A0A2V4N153_9ACTN|nr:hypothetical protein [Streptomyces tateyamensis]PYC75832.1 hypothetical protein C7C46_23455 [Streptomyces tateyamensis]